METFDHLLLLGRPAAGKSEFIDFIRTLSDVGRAELFHIGRFEEADDFAWLWEKFVEDNLWEETGYRRLYSHREGNNYGLNPEAGKLLDLMMVKFNKTVKDKYLPRAEFYRDGTLLIEFSRGGEDGFKRAFRQLSKEILERAAVLYLDVSFEESLRRNETRYEEKLKHSILAHKVTRKAMDAFYQTNDWASLTQGKPDGFLKIDNINLPFVTMKNEPELKPGPEISERYKKALDKLWALYEKKSACENI